MLTQEKRKQFYLKMVKHTRSGQKNVDSDAGFCSVFIVFARIGDDKILLVLLLKTIQVMESQ
jgi:hypothetical protein